MEIFFKLFLKQANYLIYVVETGKTWAVTCSSPFIVGNVWQKCPLGPLPCLRFPSGGRDNWAVRWCSVWSFFTEDARSGVSQLYVVISDNFPSPYWAWPRTKHRGGRFCGLQTNTAWPEVGVKISLPCDEKCDENCNECYGEQATGASWRCNTSIWQRHCQPRSMYKTLENELQKLATDQTYRLWKINKINKILYLKYGAVKYKWKSIMMNTE